MALKFTSFERHNFFRISFQRRVTIGCVKFKLVPIHEESVRGLDWSYRGSYVLNKRGSTDDEEEVHMMMKREREFSRNWNSPVNGVFTLLVVCQIFMWNGPMKGVFTLLVGCQVFLWNGSVKGRTILSQSKRLFWAQDGSSYGHCSTAHANISSLAWDPRVKICYIVCSLYMVCSLSCCELLYLKAIQELEGKRRWILYSPWAVSTP